MLARVISGLALTLLSAAVARAQDAIAIRSISAYATIGAASVLVDYSGDDDADATAYVRSRATGPFQRGHALVRLPGKRLTGSVLWLVAATDYELEVVIGDPDNGGPVTATTRVRTRDETPPASSGNDWWVDASSGLDSNPGSGALPFATIQRGADAAQPGDRVRVRPGVYRENVVPPRGGSPAAPIRFIAEGAGVVLEGADPAIQAGAAWTQVTANVWSTPFVGGTYYVAVDDARVYDYPSLAQLIAEDGDVGQPGVIAGGYFVDTVAALLYVATPDHDSPSRHQVHVAVLEYGFLLDTLTDVVIEGFEIRHMGRSANYGIGVDIRDSARCWVRGNDIHHLNAGVRVRRAMASENVIEDNQVRDTSVYGWPWASVKAHTPEASAISVTHGHGNVVRRNRTEGSFNGIYTGAFGDADEEIARDTDIHDNCLALHGDDGLELEGAQRNVRAWRNVVSGVYNAVSLAPIEAGPVFLVRNVLDGYKEHALKVNNGTYGAVFVYHTTAIPQPGSAFPDAQAIAPTLPFGAITTRNNVWEANRYVIEYGDVSLLSPIDWDNDDLYSHDSEGAGRFVKWLDVRYANLAELQASGTIERGGLSVRPTYENPVGGDYRLTAGHPLVDAGVVVSGIDDQGFAGSAPDLGAVERDGIPWPGCAAGAPLSPVLLRNAEWPGTNRASIFSGPSAGCPRPLDPGCPAPGPPALSLDPTGADCVAGGPTSGDDTYLPGFACGTSDPDPFLLADLSRPLVFYQLDRDPSACNSLRLVKDGFQSLRIDCN